MVRPRLLLVYQVDRSFVSEDRKLLGEEYELRTFEFGAPKTVVAMVSAFAKQFLWLLRELRSADVVVCWFADYHGFLPALFSKVLRIPVAVVLGGYDAISLPSLAYGAYLKRWRRAFQKYVLMHAKVLLPVSDSLISSRNSFSAWPDETGQGVRELFPDLKTPAVTIPTGYDPDEWPMGPNSRDSKVGTVATLADHVTFKRKGLDILVEAARLLPDVDFSIVGVRTEFLDEIGVVYDPPSNVNLVVSTPRHELPQLYQQMSVYVQVSRAEGLPNVLCEAMLCGCIPVGSDVFGIPDGVGDAGFVIDRPDPELLAETIRAALQSDSELRLRARNHIVRSFHRDRRRSALFGVLELIRSGTVPPSETG